MTGETEVRNVGFQREILFLSIVCSIQKTMKIFLSILSLNPKKISSYRPD